MQKNEEYHCERENNSAMEIISTGTALTPSLCTRYTENPYTPLVQ